MTPEGRVKAQVDRILARFQSIYRFKPVVSGYGASTLDYLLCAGGHFAAIETKAPGKKPTPRQEMMIARITSAGGRVFVIDGKEEQLRELEKWLAWATDVYSS